MTGAMPAADAGREEAPDSGRSEPLSDEASSADVEGAGAGGAGRRDADKKGVSFGGVSCVASGAASARSSTSTEGGDVSLLVTLLSACFTFLPRGVTSGVLDRVQQDRDRERETRGARPPQADPSLRLADDHPVQAFLLEACLAQYAGLLVSSGFDDMETLLAIDDDDMKDLGIPRGHMVKLKRRLRETCSVRTPASIVRICSVGKPPGGVSSSRCQPPTENMMSTVERSWEQLQAMGSEAVAQTLYHTFFELAPETANLFPVSVRNKYREWNSVGEGSDESDIYNSPALRNVFGKVISAVGSAVAGLHDLNQLVPRLTQLGLRHSGYGAKERHFHVLGKAVITTIQKHLGKDCTPEVEFAWTMVFNFIAAVMIGGWREGREVQATATRAQSTGRQSIAAGSDVSARSHSKALAASENSDTEEGAREIHGGTEVYRIERHLQKAIFGDVYEAVGTTSGRSFAIKVLDRDVVHRFASVQQMDHQFCESPLCEVKYFEIMKDLDHVVQMEDSFGDEFYHFVVSELATGGDLLEALRLRPGGFKERQAQLLIREAAKGLMSLHQRGLAMQDVSLENMLLYVLDDGTWQVRICDPGQAAPFTIDPVSHLEVPVPFRGFVAKDFRPPELYAKREYLATKVDSWCLGWSAFYLLVARPMFLSADPLMNDPNWALFQRRQFSKLFTEKGWRATLSPQAKDFVLRLMHVNPRQRMSIKDALRHPWLADEKIWRGCVPEPQRPLLPEAPPATGLGAMARSRSAMSTASVQMHGGGGAAAEAATPAGGGDSHAGMTIRVGCTHEFQLPALLPGRDAPLAGTPTIQSSWSFQPEEGCDGAAEWPASQPLEPKEDNFGWQPPERPSLQPRQLEKKACGDAALSFQQDLIKSHPSTEADAVAKELQRKTPQGNQGPTLLRPSPAELSMKDRGGGIGLQKEGKMQANTGFAQAPGAGFSPVPALQLGGF